MNEANLKSRLQEQLAGVEARHAIDRRALQRQLEQALEDQNRLERLAEKHSCELPAWVELAGELERRHMRSLEAIESVIAETMELDEAVFGALTKTDCIDVLRGLREEFRRALRTRTESAEFLAAIGRAYRDEHNRDSEIVDQALKTVVSELVNGLGVSRDEALEYTAALAQLCGALSAAGDARAALVARLQDRKKRFPDFAAMRVSSLDSSEKPDDAGLTVDEIANKAQQIALGLWPNTKDEAPRRQS